jgi:hypothetical protein
MEKLLELLRQTTNISTLNFDLEAEKCTGIFHKKIGGLFK